MLKFIFHCGGLFSVKLNANIYFKFFYLFQFFTGLIVISLFTELYAFMKNKYIWNIKLKFLCLRFGYVPRRRLLLDFPFLNLKVIYHIDSDPLFHGLEGEGGGCFRNIYILQQWGQNLRIKCVAFLKMCLHAFFKNVPKIFFFFNSTFELQRLLHSFKNLLSLLYIIHKVYRPFCTLYTSLPSLLYIIHKSTVPSVNYTKL